jgi:hypothetical protein
MRARQRHLNPKAAGANIIFDARYITGLSDTDPITTWTNRSGSNDATTAVDSPTYETNERGGNPIARFDLGIGSSLACTSSSFSGTGARFVMAAYKSNSTGTYTAGVAGQSGTVTTGAWFAMQVRTSTFTGDPYIRGASADTQNNKSTPDNLWKIATGAYDGTTLYTRKNGAEIDSVARTLNTNNVPFRVGYEQVTTSSAFFDGDIAYVVAGPVTYSVPLIRRLEHMMSLSYKIACS